ncbi:hypothetical protein PALU110988_27285 [Paenibacillus lupini]|uniref:hypothetical protein n=1 Tax=Paenibacillus lupini TaxID=1450204 RepID=UPI001423246E|nr:hypothetical protein [Paenibacillus lupini]NIK24187.1 hypothetical protein [Paenibacillus lupini]
MVPTKEELELIREFCLLPMLLDIVAKNKKDLEYTDSTLKPFYILIVEALLDRIHTELTDIRKELNRIKCKVNQLDRPDPAAFHFEFRLRGYHEEFWLWKSLVRSEMSIRLGKQKSEIAELLKQPSH